MCTLEHHSSNNSYFFCSPLQFSVRATRLLFLLVYRTSLRVVCLAVWNRRKQEWMEVEAGAEKPNPRAVSPISSLLSSNAYASGVNQNSGNFLTEKPITRIHAPPGGRSTISFGDYYEPAAHTTPAKKPSPAATVATPTQPTTPESLEASDGPTPIPMMELPQVPNAEGEEEEEEEEAAVVAPPLPPTVETAAPPAVHVVSANAYATGSNQNSGNFMTGRPTTRVRAPPGGVSSITFG